MSNNLQKMMASKYPSQSPSPKATRRIMRESSPSDVLIPSGDEEKSCVLSPRRILMFTILFALLFFVLSLPITFKTVGSLFPSIIYGNVPDNKLVAIHALVFAVIAFFILRTF